MGDSVPVRDCVTVTIEGPPRAQPIKLRPPPPTVLSVDSSPHLGVAHPMVAPPQRESSSSGDDDDHSA